jgi:predicted protein tyrosine phosphatase
MLAIKDRNHAAKHKRKYDAVITVEDPGAKRRVRFHSSPHPAHLVLKFEDIDHDDAAIAAPVQAHMDSAIRFAREHGGGRLLVHCQAGVCRSTAIGLAVIADRLGPGSEGQAVLALLASNPDAVPNLMMIGMADRALGRDGALEAAWAELGEKAPRIARYRANKAEFLSQSPHLFAGRPEGGHYPPRFSAQASSDMVIYGA